jgi:hypothetical protein
MNIVHPITRVLKRQIHDEHVTATEGVFHPSFHYSIGMRGKDDRATNLMDARADRTTHGPYLVITAHAPYRETIARIDGQPSSGADLIRLWDDRKFLPSKRTVRTLAGILGEGEAIAAFPYGESTGITYQDLRESEPLLQRERENMPGRPFPQLVRGSMDAYALTAHSHLGELEEKLPWFRFGTFQYGNERHLLTFEINKPLSTNGIVTVAFNLKTLDKVELPTVNAVAWYMQRISTKSDE